MDTPAVRQRGRGRPAGSGKPAYELRQRRDYRLKPSTLHQIEQGRQLAQLSETAFVEAAIAHYSGFLTEETHELDHLQTRIQDLERHLAEAQAARVQRPERARDRREPVGLAPARPVPSSSARRPTYQMFLKHEPGPCPHLPEEFAYLDLDRSIEPRQCPIHRVFARPCAIAIARQQVERLKREVPGIVLVWLDKGGDALATDSWRKEHGRWVRDD